MCSLVFVVAALSFCVDFLLLAGTGQLCGKPLKLVKTVLAAGVGSAICACAVLPDFVFLGNRIWSVIRLLLVALTACGFSGESSDHICAYLLLRMSLGWLIQGLDGVPWMLPLGAAGLLFLWKILLKGQGIIGRFIPVELRYGSVHLRLRALRDTGNLLRDPITGKPVMVLGADVAKTLIGLTPAQLRCPLESVSAFPGLRLIPYKSVSGTGFMLAMRIPVMRVGNRQGSGLVAFSPEVLSAEGTYQALSGGGL